MLGCEHSNNTVVNYRAHYQHTIIKLQRELDRAMYLGDWGAYLRLRHRIIEIKDHILEHETRCGYDCACEPEPEWAQFAQQKD